MVAHSYGANAALLAAQARPDLVRSLALLEPACFDLARGMPAVEEHIADMGAVFASASDPGLSDPDWFARFAAGRCLLRPLRTHRGTGDLGARWRVS